MKKIILLIVVVIVSIITALVFDWGRGGMEIPDLNSSNGSISIKEGNSSSIQDMPVVLNSIVDNQEVSNPITIEGKAKGTWFFEGSFPIKLVDINDNVIGNTVAKATGDWMTSDYVNFTAELQYNKSTSTDHALMILSKDNPSGKPEFARSIFIPLILR